MDIFGIGHRSWEHGSWCLTGAMLENFLGLTGKVSGSWGHNRWRFEEGWMLERVSGTVGASCW